MMNKIALSPVTEKYLALIEQHPVSARLLSAGEPYAAAVVLPGYSPLLRHSLAVALYFMHADLAPHNGSLLYPNGVSMVRLNFDAQRTGMIPDHSYAFSLDLKTVAAKVPEAEAALAAEHDLVHLLDSPHTVGGNGYTHSFLNYRRILAEGIDGYRSRVNALPDGDFKDAMTILLDGIYCYRDRCLELLRQSGADAELISALEWVPMRSPRNIYEAMVAWNFIYYLDGLCDDPGGLDRGLLPYWKGEDIRHLLKMFFANVDANDAWSIPLGPHYNGLTIQCIQAIENRRRPQMQLLVTPEMPEEVWQAVIKSLSTSCGQPALYNWENYRREITARIPEVSEEDLQYLAFGGCTETMIEGLSNVGSDDAGINTALIFDDYFREQLDKHENFDSFIEGYLAETVAVIDDVCGELERFRKERAMYRPHPIRTLFIDDCIDRQTDFNAGGARYNWSVVNVAGLINVIDSMAVIKELVFDRQQYTPADFIRLLDQQDPVFLARCAAVPKHGNDNPMVNALANRLSGPIYAAFETHTCTPGGRYFAVSNQFATYNTAGLGIRATPDGRGKDEPLCDSCGAIAGRDKLGPTALLNSVASLRLDLVMGTPITNIRISKANLPGCLKPLVTSFFENGGVQLQVTCASREELEDALIHPEKHENLIVRIGGYSEYFTRLSRTLQETVIARTEY